MAGNSLDAGMKATLIIFVVILYFVPWLVFPFFLACWFCYRENGLLPLSEVAAEIRRMPRAVFWDPIQEMRKEGFPRFLKVAYWLIVLPAGLVIGIPILAITIACMVFLGALGTLLRTKGL